MTVSERKMPACARPRLIVVLAALAVGLAVPGVAVAASRGAAAAAGPRVQALVFRGSHGAVWRDLRRRLGSRLIVRRETPARLRADRGYGVLVFDGDRVSPGALAGDRGQLRAYLDGGGWVLVLDAQPADFSRVLDGLTGFDSRPVHGRDSASVEMFRESDAYGRPTVQILEDPTLVPGDASRLSAAERRAAVAGQVRRVAGMVATRLWHRDTAIEAPKNDQDMPPEALRQVWVDSQPGSATPPAAYWASNHSVPAGISPPTPGMQTVSWTVNAQFAAYLDNSAIHPQGDYQIVTYDQNAEFTPKMLGQKFQFMDDPFRVGAADYDLERAWWTGYVENAVTPDPAADAKLTWQDSQPATPNEEGKYTSGQSFEVGFSATREGPGVSASYSVSNEQEHSVPDWGVTNETAGNDLRWLFSARDHCNVTENLYSVDGCFNWGAFQDGTPVKPNDLSLGQLTTATSGRWRTKRLLTGADGKLTFTVDTPVTFADTACLYWSIATCDRHSNGAQLFRFTTGLTGKLARVDAIDAADVVPVGVAAVNLTPNPADGSANQKVTGTVELKAPTPIAITIKLFSSDGNATLPLPLGGGVSEGSVNVPAGKSSATFTINTNANGLDKGDTETAAITAFYTEPTTTQLRIMATS